jgi:hypothetical protein
MSINSVKPRPVLRVKLLRSAALKLFQAAVAVEQATGEVINKPIERKVPVVVRQPAALLARHGGIWRFAPLGAQASGLGARSTTDEREDDQGFRQR